MKEFIDRRFLTLLRVLTTLALTSACGAQALPKKEFFLPKSPIAAAYVLNRLSNQELIDAPRSEFVYVALLQRKGLERKYRVEALEGLAKIRGTDVLSELVKGLGDLDKKGDAFEPVLRDLLPLLLQAKPVELAGKRSDLENLATQAQLPLTCQIAFAAIITSDGSAEKIWTQTAADTVQLAHLVRAVPLVRAPSLRLALHEKVEPLLRSSEEQLRHAAIVALPAIPGRESETFKTLAALVKNESDRIAAITSLQQIPRRFWDVTKAESLIEMLVLYLQTVPVEQRTEGDALSAFQFASDLGTLLPAERAREVGKILRGLGVSVIVIRTVPEQMLYDKNVIVVEAGKPVQLILQNDDAMPHNLIVTVPGALEEIGATAEKMPPQADAEGRLYVPDSPKILHSTRLVEPGQQAKLSFTAPVETGDYPYVCTFPGHWRRMNGTLAVVNDVESYLTSRAATAPKITEWKWEELRTALAQPGSEPNPSRGRELFTKLACASCHKFADSGVDYGPDLTDVFARYQRNRAELLRHILEPSLVISNRYQNFEIELKNDEPVFGMIIKEDAETLTLQSGPAESLVQHLKVTGITARRPQATSLMPSGLLNTLSQEEILDLLAWLESGGKAEAHAH